jgi:hypothetical protein
MHAQVAPLKATMVTIRYIGCLMIDTVILGIYVRLLGYVWSADCYDGVSTLHVACATAGCEIHT